MKVSARVKAKVKRGKESWQLIYIFLGFALTLEAAVISMISPIKFPFNIMIFALVAAVTFWTFICSGHFQNWLIGKVNSYEKKSR